MKVIINRIITVILASCMIFSLIGCSLDSAKETMTTTAGNAKDAVVDWYSNLDFSKFEEGWDYSVEFLGSQYSAVMSTEYIASVEDAISTLKSDMNASAGTARGTAQEAGFLAEKWVTDTFNINSTANGSSYSAETVGSNEFGSVDVSTNYGENASLKYYQDANASASAQAKTVLESYKEYCSSTTKENPPTLAEYMDERGYDSNSQGDLLASVYEGQTRIIPTDQLDEATQYLQGRINKLSTVEGSVAEGRVQSYQETLNNLRDRLQAPDGTESAPLSREEAQAIAELSKEGDFKPEDFGITVSSVLSPKYVVKQAMGTGLQVGTINAVLSTGPDIYSILKEAAETGELDEDALKKQGIEAAIAGSEGFVEGSVCRVVTTMCESGAFGAALKDANPSVVATLTVLIIEASVHGYELSQGKITAEEYGNMMVDRAMVMFLALPTSALLLAVLPASNFAMMAGCMAGAMIAAVGYTAAKEAVLDIVDGGGFEAVIPVQAADTASVASEKIASLNIKDQVSDLSDTVISTASDGYIKVSSYLSGD